jgi:hypothetical protein
LEKFIAGYREYVNDDAGNFYGDMAKNLQFSGYRVGWQFSN